MARKSFITVRADFAHTPKRIFVGVYKRKEETPVLVSFLWSVEGLLPFRPQLPATHIHTSNIVFGKRSLDRRQFNLEDHVIVLLHTASLFCRISEDITRVLWSRQRRLCAPASTPIQSSPDRSLN